jgi:hypothetical protein
MTNQFVSWTIGTTIVLALAGGACRAGPARDGTTSRSAEATDTALRHASPGDTIAPDKRDSLLKVLDVYGRGFGDDRATVIARMGRALHESATLEGIDTLIRFTYPSASFIFTRSTAHRVDNLDEIRVWGPLPGWPRVIALGATTQSQLLAALGTPQDRIDTKGDSTVLPYELIDPDFTVVFECYVVHDTVRVVRWRFRMG